MAVQVLSAKLPTGDGVFAGVTLEPYVLIRKGEATLTSDDLPEEGTQDAPGQYQLRSRWFRCTIQRGGNLCCVHPDKDATLQCIICQKLKVPNHLSFHCSIECLRSHWHLHKNYHQHLAQPNGGTTPADPAESGPKSLETWQEVGKGRLYTPSPDDVGYQLKLEVCVVEKSHSATEGRTSMPQIVYTQRVRPPPNPPQRALVSLLPKEGSASTHGRFTLLTYNLLADLYCKQTDYSASNCPPWMVHWQYRKKQLLQELKQYKADILCLQEVQSDAYADFWAPELQKLGYAPIYKKKTTEMFTDNKYAMDGCATFFRRDKFSLVKKYEVEFNKAALSLADGMPNPTIKKAALNRLLKDNVAVIAVLEAVEPAVPAEGPPRRTLLCVANTHIHANPELSDVKIWQVHTLLKGLEKIAASADIPMLVAGDFNSTPGSPAHCLLVKGRIDPALLEGQSDPLQLLKDQKMSHTLQLASAAAAVLDAPTSADPRLHKQKQRICPKTREPQVTNMSRDFKGTLDYIFYTSHSLTPTAFLELPSEGELLPKPWPDAVLPTASYASDHIALLAEFAYLRT